MWILLGCGYSWDARGTRTYHHDGHRIISYTSVVIICINILTESLTISTSCVSLLVCQCLADHTPQPTPAPETAILRSLCLTRALGGWVAASKQIITALLFVDYHYLCYPFGYYGDHHSVDYQENYCLLCAPPIPRK